MPSRSQKLGSKVNTAEGKVAGQAEAHAVSVQFRGLYSEELRDLSRDCSAQMWGVEQRRWKNCHELLVQIEMTSEDVLDNLVFYS